MSRDDKLNYFNSRQIQVVNQSSAMAEDLVSNDYKLSSSQWLHRKYDIKTLADLTPDEIVCGPFAQILRYEGKKKNSLLGSSAYDFYKICLLDHSILAVLNKSPELKLFPFTLYIIVHELIHIVRFGKFLQGFDASMDKKVEEEQRVHKKTHDILSNVHVHDMPQVLKFYEKWKQPIDSTLYQSGI